MEIVCLIVFVIVIAILLWGLFCTQLAAGVFSFIIALVLLILIFYHGISDVTKGIIVFFLIVASILLCGSQNSDLSENGENWTIGIGFIIIFLIFIFLLWSLFANISYNNEGGLSYLW
jgi:hypothetical protein